MLTYSNNLVIHKILCIYCFVNLPIKSKCTAKRVSRRNQSATRNMSSRAQFKYSYLVGIRCNCNCNPALQQITQISYIRQCRHISISFNVACNRVHIKYSTCQRQRANCLHIFMYMYVVVDVNSPYEAFIQRFTFFTHK